MYIISPNGISNSICVNEQDRELGKIYGYSESDGSDVNNRINESSAPTAMLY